MVRVVMHLVKLNASGRQSDWMQLHLPDPETGQTLSIGQWLDRVRLSPTPAMSANAFLSALKQAILQRNASGQQFMHELNQPMSSLARALQSIVPGNDRHKANETLRAWIGNNCPLPHIQYPKVRPLRLEMTLDEEEHHPFGVSLGFARIS
jgi:hypothetical protein